jgi:xanthine dehydrogenase YagS FAD-binding subunit
MHAIFGASEQCIAVHPSDMCVALTALDATVTITGGKGERKMAFADFHRLPGNTPEKDNNLQKGELITTVDIPFNSFAKHSHYLKIRDRASYAFALVSVAAALDIQDGRVQDARLVMGGVAHKPWRLHDAENVLKGQPATEPVFRKAAEAATQQAKSYGHNDFKKILAVRAITEALKTATIIHSSTS